MQTRNILIIDDDEAFRRMLLEALTNKGFEASGVGSAEEGLEFLKGTSVDFVLLDVQLPGMSGIEALEAVRSADSRPDVIVMTAFSDKETAITALSKGAHDYFSKPFSLKEMEVVLNRAIERRRLQEQVRSLKETIRTTGPMQRVIGDSPEMHSVREMIERVAQLDATVLITGESGTGKGLAADTIHALSPRSSGPYVKLNCAAIPESLLESELFGFEKGAFTGALKRTAGKFELASGGSLLLDEIGDMPLTIQPKLLRVVEEKQVERLGGGLAVAVDTRIIAATNQDLESLIHDKSFRQDLYYRLNVAAIRLPPLRERRQDVPLLIEHFLKRMGLGPDGGRRTINDEAVDMAAKLDWPGNVRQLANALERAAIASPGSTITAKALTQAVSGPMAKTSTPSLPQGLSLRETLIQVEKAMIIQALSHAGGRQTEAARLLGVSPKNLWNKIKKHGIDPKSPGNL
jgi:two-component system response regulator AtoC